MPPFGHDFNQRLCTYTEIALLFTDPSLDKGKGVIADYNILGITLTLNIKWRNIDQYYVFS